MIPSSHIGWMDHPPIYELEEWKEQIYIDINNGSNIFFLSNSTISSLCLIIKKKYTFDKIFSENGNIIKRIIQFRLITLIISFDVYTI